MHRSGTSFFVRALQGHGVGLPTNLLAAASDNPDGFQEPADLVDLNERLLNCAGGLWDASWPLQLNEAPVVKEQIGQELQNLLNQWCISTESSVQHSTSTGLLALKDPRLCRTLALIAPYLEQNALRYGIAIIRNPNAVVSSLLERNGDDMSPLKGFALWMRYNLEMVKCRSINPQISDWPIISFESLVKTPLGTLQPILQQWQNEGLLIKQLPKQDLACKPAKLIPDHLSQLPKDWLELAHRFYTSLQDSKTLKDVPEDLIQAVQQWLEQTPELSNELLALEARRRAHLGNALATERLLSWRNL